MRGSGRFRSRRIENQLEALAFNPLHCGAVVASRPPPHGGGAKEELSIPFIAGQWSLRQAGPGLGVPGLRLSIPFIAGQWSLQSPRGKEVLDEHELSIPFIAGQWSLRSQRVPRQRSPEVSIPFIAGQWSLPRAQARAQREIEACFNPLHCGAVVASAEVKNLTGVDVQVSIPFIAGQWSLHAHGHADAERACQFQSPSLRGSGRFPITGSNHNVIRARFNPLHCGAVVASSRRRCPPGVRRSVSIPFIAGQWSLRRFSTR